MKIALLVCDDSNRTFEHNSGSYVDMFVDLFAPLKDEVSRPIIQNAIDQNREFQKQQDKKHKIESDDDFSIEQKKEKIELIPFDVRINEYPNDLNIFDGFLTTGSVHSVYEKLPWINTLKNFIQKLCENNHKYFGICFGHQLIAQSLGGKVEQSNEGWMVGVKQTNIIKPQPWMTPRQSSCHIISSHRDQIVELPPGAEVVGHSQGCPNSMIKLGETFIGFQGHPEFSKEYALPLMISRHDQMNEETIEAAKKSFEVSPDQHLLRNWIINFFSK